jgi:hypothetical protein
MKTNLRFEATSSTGGRSQSDAAQWAPVDSPSLKTQEPIGVTSTSPKSVNDPRDILLGCGVGLLAGASFGIFVSWWFFVDSTATALILTLHAGFAGVAMGAWLLPTLRSP